MQYKPHSYQDYATNWILNNKAAGLFLDMGMGKTIATLTAINDLMYDRFEVCKVLVIAPLRVAQDTWSRETAKWDHLKHLKIAKVLGPEAKRISALNQEADIYIVNRENVPWLVDFYKAAWPFDMVVIDELSSFKSSKAQRFKALRRVRKKIDRLVGLTGTPAPNGLIDLWPQLYLLDEGESLGKTVTGYRERYFLPDKRNATTIFTWRLKRDAEQAIYKKIASTCISMKACDYLQVPERLEITVPVTLDEKAATLYKQLEQESLLEFESGNVAGLTAAVLTNKLLQMANGAVYDDVRGVQEIHRAKLEALEDLIEAANGQPVLVFYNYQHDRDRIQAVFPQAKQLEDSNDIEAWNQGNIPILLAHPASAGHGLNLQTGGHHIIWFGLTWSLELYQQANARLHRQGQEERVIIHHLVAEGTMDEQVMKALERKDVSQEALLEALKARIKKGAIK